MRKVIRTMKGKLAVGFILALHIVSLCNIPVVHTEGEPFTLIKAFWGELQPTEASPGTTETLTVILRYELDYTFSDLIGRLQLPEGFEAVGSGETMTGPYTGIISAGSLVTLAFPVFISEEVPLGEYTAQLDLEYRRSRYVLSEDRVAIPLDVTGKPDIRVASVEENLYEGKQTIGIEFRNEGDAVAENVEVQGAMASGASTEFVGPVQLGTLEPGAAVIAPLEVIIPQGSHGNIITLTVEVHYLGPTNVFYPESKDLHLLVKPTLILPLRIDLAPHELTIGEHTFVTVTLTNAENHTLSNVELTLSPDTNLKILSEHTVFTYSVISPKDSVQVSLEIYVPASVMSPTASLNLLATSFNEESWLEQRENYTLNFLLRGLIEITLTDQVVIPAEPRMGSPFSATITITNIGTSTAYAADASPALANLPIKTFGPQSVYIGNIELNLPTTFTINLLLENTTDAEFLLPVTLTYMDNLRAPYNITFTIPIAVYQGSNTSPETPQDSPVPPFRGLLLGVGGVAIAAVVIVILWRRRT